MPNFLGGGLLASVIYKFFLEGIHVLHTRQEAPPEAEDFCLFSNSFANGLILSKESQLLGFLTLLFLTICLNILASEQPADNLLAWLMAKIFLQILQFTQG